MVLILLHFLTAISAIAVGVINLASGKGTLRHRILGWCWLVLMTCVTVSSFWIREIGEGHFSWIHLLSVWAIINMIIAVISIKKGYVKIHANCMIGTMIGAIIAAGFAMIPGRFVSVTFGYS